MVAKDGEIVQDVLQRIRKANCVFNNSTQCEKTADYILGPNSASSAVMISRCCYMDLRNVK
jgi:histidinol dehydrogenase